VVVALLRGFTRLYYCDACLLHNYGYLYRRARSEPHKTQNTQYTQHTHTTTHTPQHTHTIMKLHDATDGCCNFFGFFNNNNDRLVQPPSTRAPDWAELESELTQDLTRMRIEDRERVLEDLHGIANVADEDPDLIERALYELDLELERKKRGTSYELAQSLNREYVAHRKLRLQFLRADDMDTKAAADRLIKFFDNKRHLFGIDLLTKDIRRQDLDEYDMEALFSGMSQIAPEKDRAGRPIIVFTPALGLYHSIENMVGGSEMNDKCVLVLKNSVMTCSARSLWHKGGGAPI
jgi:hypothetical protein